MDNSEIDLYASDDLSMLAAKCSRKSDEVKDGTETGMAKHYAYLNLASYLTGAAYWMNVIEQEDRREDG